MSDDGVQVKFSADIAGLLDGLSEGQESLRMAAEGMKGDLGALAKSFEALGPAALAAGAGMMEFEGMKELINDFFETTERSNQLAESFKQLEVTAGMTAEKFNGYNAAITMAGGTSSDLEAITRGMERGIKANADVLIANGIAADKASLAHMDLGQYIAKVVEVMDTYGSATDKDKLLMEAFGRSGMQFARVIKEMNEHMKEGQELADKGGPVNQKALDLLEETKAATAKLKLEQEEYDAILAQTAGGVSNAWKNIKSSILETKIASELATQAMHQGLIAVALDAVTGELDIRKLREEYDEFLKVQKEVAAGSMDAGAKYGPSDRNTATNTDQQDLEAAKKAAEEKKRLAKEAAAEAKREQEAQSRNAVSEYEWELQYLRKQKAEEEKLYKEEQANVIAVYAWEERYIEESAKHQAAAETKAATDAYNADMEAIANMTGFKKGNSEAQLAATLAAVDKELKAKLAALEKERAALEKMGKDIRPLLDKEVELTQEAENKKKAITDASDKHQEEMHKKTLDGMTQNWDRGVQAMLHHQMTFSQGVRSASKQMEDQFERSVINMGLQWIKGMLLQMITSKTAHESQNMMDAKDAYSGAYKATVGIPYVGPFLAPAAGAAAFAAVMAFAEQGYDVPAGVNPVTQLHAKEMVLPAALAEGVRNMTAQGGGSAQTIVHNHISTVDAAGFGALLNKYPGQLMAAIGGNMRNGRRN